MALVVITLQDEGEGDEASVDVKFLFEPLIKDDSNTPAQMMAVTCPACKGTGRTLDDDKCPRCHGKGKVYA